MKATHEILTTKDKDNILHFHNDNYFMNGKGTLKTKYYKAIQELHKNKMIEINATFNENQNEWLFFWS